MTQEEKARAYDKVSKEVKDFFEGRQKMYSDVTQTLEYLFPELVESEDEKIRKAIIDFLWKEKIFLQEVHSFVENNPKYRFVVDAIAWLEKQGEQKSIDDLTQQEAMDIAVAKCFEQGEQKPVDKMIKPKFKVGDWVVNKLGDVWRIDNFDKKNYQVYDGKGNYNYFPISKQDEMHLWTIADAREGDVLCCESGWTCIFKTLVNDETFSSYCFMDKTKWFCETGSECHTLNKEFTKAYSGEIKPATKEQRDLLFQKMKEAGYEWDADKKELSEIKQESADKVEPKLNIESGKWYVCNTPRYTDFIVGKAYYCPKNGMLKPNENTIARYVARDCFHLWTIQDAKDGDVLAVDSMPFIYNGSKNEVTVGAYCGFNAKHRFSFAYNYVYNYVIKQNITPATKEQCDKLEKAITDAGYKWDSEKKELRKIEQKPIDKIESKFKVGNWYQCTKDFFGKGVTFDKNTAYYCAIEGCLQDEYGCHIAIVEDLYDNFKLWTIEDAKDGDVLANGKMIVIFKHFEEPSYRQHIIAYIGLDLGGDIQITDDTWRLGIDKAKPATKEQRDLLFSKMKEAGYVWDSNKKELKKIKQNIGWSEEDEHRTKDAIYFLETAKKHYASTIELDACIAWLESLKQRMEK